MNKISINEPPRRLSVREAARMRLAMRVSAIGREERERRGDYESLQNPDFLEKSGFSHLRII
ncbi:MAG: hypothetical protein AB1861_18420 [Cyanobacteriota bacterium]